MGFNKVGNTTSVQVVTIKKKQDLFAKVGRACLILVVVLPKQGLQLERFFGERWNS